MRRDGWSLLPELWSVYASRLGVFACCGMEEVAGSEGAGLGCDLIVCGRSRTMKRTDSMACGFADHRLLLLSMHLGSQMCCLSECSDMHESPRRALLIFIRLSVGFMKSAG
jgi:hypothetical protein